MTKEEFINNLPELEDYQAVYEYILPKNGGKIEFSDGIYDYEEMNMEEFFGYEKEIDT